MIPCVEVIDGDGTLTGENANQYWSSIMPATWSYMLAARSRGLGTTRTGMTIEAHEEMPPILGLRHRCRCGRGIGPPAMLRAPTSHATLRPLRRCDHRVLDPTERFHRDHTVGASSTRLGGGAAVEPVLRREQRINGDDVDVDAGFLIGPTLAGESTLGPVLLVYGVLLGVQCVDDGRVSRAIRATRRSAVECAVEYPPRQSVPGRFLPARNLHRASCGRP